MKRQPFLNSLLYFMLLSGLTFVSWVFKLDLIGTMTFSLFAFILLIFKKNAIHVVPVLFNMLFIISRKDWDIASLPMFYFFIPVIIISGFVVHYIRFRKEWVFGKLTLPFILLFVGMVLSVLTQHEYHQYQLFYIAFGLFYLLFYLFFTQTIHGDQLDYLIQLFFVLGILVSFEVLYHYISHGDIASSLREDRVHLGWGLSNYVATYLIIFIPAAIYFVKNKPLKFLSSIVIAFEILMLLFTLSRGGTLTLIILTPFLVLYLFYHQKHKLNIVLNVLLIFALLSMLFIFRTDYIQPLLDRFYHLDLTDGSGRVDLWRQALQKFKENPLFGAGVLSRFEGGRFHFYHNTILHTMASFGLVGLASLIWQMIVVIILFFKKTNSKIMILFLAIFGANIHGMIDNVYYQLQFMVIFFVIVAVVEAYHRDQIHQPKIWRLKDAQSYKV